MKQKNPRLQQDQTVEDQTVEEQLEKLMRQELKDIRFHPATPRIPDVLHDGWDREENRSVRLRPQQDQTVEEQLDELLRRELKDITFYPVAPRIPDVSYHG